MENRRNRKVTLYRWANEYGRAGMPKPEDLEKKGWVRVYQHHIWPDSWMMRREGGGRDDR